MTHKDYDFSGIWRSTYQVESGLGKGIVETEHYVTVYRRDNHLIVESIPSSNGSYLWAKFTLDGRIATGMYHSENSPHSSKKGAIYYGAAQMVLDLDGHALRGKGVGFGKNLEIKTSNWELVHVGKKVPGEVADQTADAVAAQ